MDTNAVAVATTEEAAPLLEKVQIKTVATTLLNQ